MTTINEERAARGLEPKGWSIGFEYEPHGAWAEEAEGEAYHVLVVGRLRGVDGKVTTVHESAEAFLYRSAHQSHRPSAERVAEWQALERLADRLAPHWSYLVQVAADTHPGKSARAYEYRRK